jgi:hypothetical protein
MHPTNCLNCEADLHTGFKYCAKCGQSTDIHRLNFHELGHDALHYVTHADKGIFHLLRELAIRPGVVAREYMAGKRKKYFKPVNFFLIVAGILVFMTSYFHYIDDSFIKNLETNSAAIQDPILQQKMMAMVERIKNVNHYTSKYSNVVNMFATPLYAAIFWLCYRRSRYTYIEHLVANMYFMGFTMLVFSLFLVPWQKILLTNGNPWRYMIILFCFEIFYRTMAYYRFINKKGTWPFLKAMGVSVLPVIIWVGGSWLLLDQYIKTGFK